MRKKKKFDWNDIEGVLLYELKYRRSEINSLLMRDLYLIFHGRGNKFIADQKLLRNATAIISDVTNQTMGGKGAREAVFQMWPLPGDKDENGGREMTREERRALIKRHHEILEAKKKQDGRNEDTDRG